MPPALLLTLFSSLIPPLHFALPSSTSPPSSHTPLPPMPGTRATQTDPRKESQAPELTALGLHGSPLPSLHLQPQPDLQVGVRPGHQGPELLPGWSGVSGPASGVGGTILPPRGSWVCSAGVGWQLIWGSKAGTHFCSPYCLFRRPTPPHPPLPSPQHASQRSLGVGELRCGLRRSPERGRGPA